MAKNEDNPRKTWRIRSFSQRGSRLGHKYDELVALNQDLFLRMAPGASESLVAPRAEFSLAQAFGREAPLIVEVGSGSGEQAVSYAEKHPDVDVICVEAWAPGAARCLSRIVHSGVTNVRVLQADAAQALPVLFGLANAGANDPDEALALGPAINPEHPNSANPRAQEVWTFFPDPWRKARHHKRRLVAPPFATTVSGILADGGVWRLATDWDNYAWQMRNVVETTPWLENPYVGERPDVNDEEPERGGFAPRWEERTLTRFEQRGIEAGRTVHDIQGVRKPRV
ncbi:tRNA (guanine(46)-N(7))-methyltransferase TrmB [Actinotignum urinale]|uniref:tRNA (guanine(46)-N(7))-methyltransferase TrmB n=1 Tax=Actinotignum urinale TaxID=190146 RepID=UPI0003B36FF9|nr:tRNA (guanine-N(7)-)-methyltransferase [Actinotignum urinale]MDY5160120.1 tRNA (guanine-N7)-methyltransferase [Actinotignum urinale]